MNILPCQISGAEVSLEGVKVKCGNYRPASASVPAADARTEIGIRPEFVHFSDDAHSLPVQVRRVDDIGRQLVHVTHQQHEIKVICSEEQVVPSDGAKIEFDVERTFLYVNGWLAGRAKSA